MIGRRVLVVDDNENNRLLVRAVLAPGEFDVFEAQNAAEALAEIERDLPAAAIVDLSLPGEDGAQLIAAIRARPQWHDLILILYTATTPTPVMQDFMTAMRVAAVITKPAEPQIILQTLSQALEMERR